MCSLRIVLNAGVKVTVVGSINDQVRPDYARRTRERSKLIRVNPGRSTLLGSVLGRIPSRDSSSRLHRLRCLSDFRLPREPRRLLCTSPQRWLIRPRSRLSPFRSVVWCSHRCGSFEDIRRGGSLYVRCALPDAIFRLFRHWTDSFLRYDQSRCTTSIRDNFAHGGSDTPRRQCSRAPSLDVVSTSRPTEPILTYLGETLFLHSCPPPHPLECGH